MAVALKRKVTLFSFSLHVVLYACVYSYTLLGGHRTELVVQNNANRMFCVLTTVCENCRSLRRVPFACLALARALVVAPP